VDDGEVALRMQGRDAGGHLTNRAVGDGEKEDPVAREPKALARGDQSRMKGTREAPT
jgi:hypothetical protein